MARVIFRYVYGFMGQLQRDRKCMGERGRHVKMSIAGIEPGSLC